MIIYPAIDLLGGKCVRLYKGDYNKSEQVANNPIETALRFKKEGAEYLHVVDLDSAKEGSSLNFPIIKELAGLGLKVQTGGGIRSLEKIESCLKAGIKRVIIGSKAVSDRNFLIESVKEFKGAIVVGIDALNKTVRTFGWLQDSGVNYLELAKIIEDIGVESVIYTDIQKDGTLEGCDVLGTKALIDSTNMDIVASGGICKKEELTRLKDIGSKGAILGKSLYSGSITLEDLKLVKGEI